MNDYDRRLVDLYDEDNPDGPDHDFYRSLADEVGAGSILDLGCGTGILTTTFARDGRTVVGVDPSATMLDYARARDGAEAVTWILGDGGQIPPGPFDYAVMTGNVAQHIPDSAWIRTLGELRASLRTGGTLAFESRNPAVRAWDGWASAERTTRSTVHGPVTEWMEVEETSPGTVMLRAHNLFVDSDDLVTEEQLLTFRDEGTLREQLAAAGFAVRALHGDWRRGPFTGTSPLLIVVATAR